MTTFNRRPSLEEVLDEMFYSAAKPTADVVRRACENYPEYRADIVEFAALWASYDSSREHIDETAYPKVTLEDVSRLQSYVLNRIHELDVPADMDMARAAVASLAGGKLARTAAALGFGDSALLLTKVLTTISNVPPRVLRDLAQLLNVTEWGLQRCLSPQLAGARSYKSDSAPHAPSMETWESAVRSLPVSEDEKRRLLAFQTEGDAS